MHKRLHAALEAGAMIGGEIKGVYWVAWRYSEDDVSAKLGLAKMLVSLAVFSNELRSRWYIDHHIV